VLDPEQAELFYMPFMIPQARRHNQLQSKKNRLIFFVAKLIIAGFNHREMLLVKLCLRKHSLVDLTMVSSARLDCV
jgi:hypothetical protein